MRIAEGVWNAEVSLTTKTGAAVRDRRNDAHTRQRRERCERESKRDTSSKVEETRTRKLERRRCGNRIETWSHPETTWSRRRS